MTSYKAELHDLITIREAIERLLVHRGRRGGLVELGTEGAGEAGRTHFRPKEWTDDDKILLRSAFISAHLDLLVRCPSNKAAESGEMFERIPSDKLAESKAFHVALPGEKIIARMTDSLAEYNGRDLRVSRSQFEKWFRKQKRLLRNVRRQGAPSKTSKRGRPPDQFGLAIAISQELFRGLLVTRYPPREVAAQIVVAAQSQHGRTVSLSTALRAVRWRLDRRSARP
jgi:hypothetical protein